MTIDAQLKSSQTFLGRANWRLIAYWTFTLFVAYENLDGSIWAFLRIEYVRVLLTHLGYPQYFLNILGPFEFACAVALLVPRFPVVKEWAYTGAFINYSAALASHLSVGDRPEIWIPLPHHGSAHSRLLGTPSTRPAPPDSCAGWRHARHSVDRSCHSSGLLRGPRAIHVAAGSPSVLSIAARMSHNEPSARWLTNDMLRNVHLAARA